MSVTSFKEIHDGRDGGVDAKGKKSVRQYTRVFRATTDSNYDEAAVVLAYARSAGLVEGSVYPYDAGAYCQSLKARNEGFSKRIWIVTAAYSSEKEMNENPLDEPAEVEWNTEQFQTICTKDRDDKGVLNGAGDYFDPPVMKDDSRWSATVIKNVSDVPTWFMDGYKDAINEDSFMLDGKMIGEKIAKIQSIRLSKWQERNDVRFKVLTMVLHFNEDTWDEEVLNQGLRCIDPDWPDPAERVPCLNGDGTRVSAPALLDEDGYQLDDPSLDNATYITVAKYPLKTFSVLPLT